MHPIRLTPWILLMALEFLSPTFSADKPTYWTLKPKADDRLPNGTMTVVGGKTNPLGVHFSLPGLSINQPVSMQVVSKDPTKVLEFRAFRDTPAQPLVTKETDEKGVAQLFFRTGETMYFRLISKDPEMVDYQLAVCVGPAVTPPGDDYFASPREVKTPAEQPKKETEPVVAELTPPEKKASSEATDQPPVKVAETAPPGPPPTPAVETKPPVPPAPPAAPPPAAPVEQNSGFQTIVIALLALIFVALAVLILVLLKKKPSATSMILVTTALLLGQTAGAEEDAPTVRITKLGPPPPPGLVSSGDSLDPNKDFIVKSKATYDNFRKADSSVRGLINKATTVRELLEYFEIIDGKEKLVVADLSPRGLPKLPSSYRGDLTPTAQQTMKFNEINGKIQKAHQFLENNYVVYKQTMITTGRIKDLQKAAANMNSFAQLALMVQGDTVPAEKAFNDKYDGAVENGLKFLDDALKEMSEFEEKEYGFKNWYAYNGIHFYNFMLSRYTRK